MATTKYKIAENVLRMLSGGNVTLASKWHINDIKDAVEKALNAVLKIESLTSMANYGETIPNGAVLATYEGRLVEAYKSVSRVKLPAMPLKLPRNVGVFQVMPEDHSCQYIPLEMGVNQLIKSQSDLISTILGRVGFTPYGEYLEFTQDLTTDGEEFRVDIRLIVLDMSKYTDWDILPIPPDMEYDVVKMVFDQFANWPVKDSVVDPGTKEQTGTPINQQSMN